MTLIESPVAASVGMTGQACELTEPRVVVVVDQRPSSTDALAWAADEALCRGMPLRIVTAFADPGTPGAPRTVEQALHCQHRLLRQLTGSRPWLDEAERLVRRGSVHTLLSEAAGPGDVLVVSEAADVSVMAASQRPRCPAVIVPAQPGTPVGR